MISSSALLLLLTTCVGTTYSKPIMLPQTNDKLIRSHRRPYEVVDKLLGRKKIVGGVEAEVLRYPYMVSLFVGTNPSPSCGGTLIFPNWVLSAAQCAGATGVLIGHHEIDNAPGSAQFINVEYEILHPEFNSLTLEHDLMMIKLETSTSFPTMALSTTTPETGTNVTVIGWGATVFGGCVSNELREVTVEMVDQAECSDAYDGDVTEDMLCATAPGKDACQGDGGGPVFIKGDDFFGDTLIGVTSWGYGCACEGYPGVYADTAKQFDFIYDTISNDTKPETYPEPCEFPDDGFDYGECEVMYPCYVGDGVCSFLDGYNAVECNNDGGDCESLAGQVMGSVGVFEFILSYLFPI